MNPGFKHNDDVVKSRKTTDKYRARIRALTAARHLGYKRTENALQTYLALATQDHSGPLPGARQTVAEGDIYSGIEQLGQRLRLLGDLPQGAVVIPNSVGYNAPLVEGVKHFQARHGLRSDGKLDKGTLRKGHPGLKIGSRGY